MNTKYYLKKFLKKNLLSYIVIFILVCLDIYTSILYMKLADSAISKNVKGVFYNMAIYLAVYLVLIILNYFKTVLVSKAIARMNNQLRVDISKSITNKTYTKYYSKEIGDYISWYINDVDKIENAGFKNFFAMYTSITKLIVAIIVLFSFHWSIIAVTIPLALVMKFAPSAFKQKIGKAAGVLSKKQEVFSSSINDNLSGFSVLRSFGLKGKFITKMKNASEGIENEKVNYIKTESLCSNGLALLNLICQMITNGLIFTLAALRYITPGTIVGSGNMVGTIFNTLREVANFKLSFASSDAYLDKLDLNIEDKEVKSLEKITKKIEFKDVSFSYGEKEVLNKLNLEFNIGSKYALVGTSGCGKSTVLKLLLGQLEDYNGKINFDSNDAKNYSSDTFYKQMAYIGQDVFLFNDSIRENITLGDKFTEEEINKAIRDSALADDLIKFEKGLDTNVGENGRNLSGGQKQRISIARALIHNRSILLVDEGTSALDKKNADIVETKLLDNKNITVILVSHHLDEERKSKFTEVYDIGKLKLEATNA